MWSSYHMKNIMQIWLVSSQRLAENYMMDLKQTLFGFVSVSRILLKSLCAMQGN